MSIDPNPYVKNADPDSIMMGVRDRIRLRTKDQKNAFLQDREKVECFLTRIREDPQNCLCQPCSQWNDAKLCAKTG